MKKNVVWLASYPKSGNTWLRSILVHLLQPAQKDDRLDYLKHIRYVSDRRLFDEYSGIDSSDLCDEEISLLRPKVYETMSSHSKENLFFKIHDAYQILSNGEALISKKASKSIVYIVRNPLDVAVSFSAFKRSTIDKVIEEMNDKSFCLADSKHSLKMEIRQYLSSWSNHVESWTKQKDIPVLVVRYEDLICDVFGVVSQVVEFLELPCSIQQIKLAIDESSFYKLKKMEEDYGYLEKHSNCNSFFRSGVSGEGIKKLTQIQVEKIKLDHQEMMQFLGYL
ncbi:sulfotransferase domain-containing protein [bacterium]|nr:sulfotransferase domain-containing protein [bacterium]